MFFDELEVSLDNLFVRIFLVEAVLDARVEAAEAVAGCQYPPPVEQTAAAAAKLGELTVLGHRRFLSHLGADIINKTLEFHNYATLK